MCLRKKCGANEWCAIKVLLLLLVVANSLDTHSHTVGETKVTSGNNTTTCRTT